MEHITQLEFDINNDHTNVLVNTTMKQDLEYFSKTKLFHKIIRSIIEKNIFLDQESLLSFPEKTLSFFDIPELTEQDLLTFFDCLTDDKLIVPQHVYEEDNNSCEHTISEKLGLKVFIIWGLNSCIQIYSSSLHTRGKV